MRTLLQNGRIIDGSGKAAYLGDLLIVDGRIAQIGQAFSHALMPLAEQIIDCTGLVIAPGFIDVHTHDDAIVLDSPQMLPKISQGITTVITGNCGISLVPYVTDDPAAPMGLLGKKQFRFNNLTDYADAVDAAHPAVNVAALIGHTSLRASVMKDFDHAASAEEREAMEKLLQQAMDDGALGLSSGIFYEAAFAADEAELLALATVAAKAGGIYATHIRSELDGIIEALHEAALTAYNAKLPLVLSHHKCANPPNWGRTTETLALVDRLATHQPIGMDVYPYTAGSTVLREDLVDGVIDIIVTQSEPYPEMAGRFLADIANEWKVTQQAACLRLQPGGACYFQMREDDVQRVLSHPRSMIGSDGLPHDDHPHPRLWGTFPRVLGHYCRDVGLFSLENAVFKMTGLPAAQFGLAERGMLIENNIADIVVFDAKTVCDKSTFADPCLASEGIKHVFVNGKLGYSDADDAGKIATIKNRRHGQFIRKKR